VQVRDLEAVYPLLHALVGRQLRDFFVRAAVLDSLIATGRPHFDRNDMAEALYWLPEPHRQLTIKALRDNGWLEYEPSVGDALTASGLWAHEILGYLRQHVKADELMPTLQGLEYARSLG